MNDFEHLSFERLIEIERRRANWGEAYALVEPYQQRCSEGLGGAERAQRALNTLER